MEYTIELIKFNLTNVEFNQIIEGLALMFLAFLISYFIRRRVTIYNCDFDGRYRRVGMAYLMAKDGYYEVSLSNTIKKKECTNRYLICLDHFNLGRIYGAKVLVKLGDKKVTIELDDDMEVVF